MNHTRKRLKQAVMYFATDMGQDVEKRYQSYFHDEEGLISYYEIVKRIAYDIFVHYPYCSLPNYPLDDIKHLEVIRDFACEMETKGYVEFLKEEK